MTNKPQLFLLHFAGGNTYSFQFLKQYLPEFEFLPLELPGRGRRIKETLITEFDHAVEDIYNQVLKHLRGAAFMIYGHSMGSVIALKVAANLEISGFNPLQIIVSGNPGPGIRENKSRYLMEQDVFKEELRSIGGVPEEVLANEELFNFFVPILKADFEVVEKNEMILFNPVKAPIYAIMGAEEEKAAQIINWKNFTLSNFQYQILEGNHFFIYRHAAQIAGIIRECYKCHPANR